MLRSLFAMLALVAVPFCRPCVAQDTTLGLRQQTVRRAHALSDSSVAVLTPTPEMWFYEQERKRHDDPKLTIRARAEQRAAQRGERLASMKWYGFSNSRPTVSPTPWFSSYSDHWGSNSYDPLRWRMPAVPLVVLRGGTERY